MTRYVAFLRGINLGRRRLRMAELRRHLTALGLGDVQTVLASGNAIFEATLEGKVGEASGDEARFLEERIEEGLERGLGFTVDTFLRTLDQLRSLAGSELVVDARDERFTPHVAFLRDEPGPEVAEQLAELEGDDDRLHLLGRELLWLRRGRLSDAPFSTRELQRALGGASNTLRNLNTVDWIVDRFG